ncbi:hypothetical protein ACHAWF_001863 [Thalassiosira exigua]
MDPKHARSHNSLGLLPIECQQLWHLDLGVLRTLRVRRLSRPHPDHRSQRNQYKNIQKSMNLYQYISPTSAHLPPQ